MREAIDTTPLDLGPATTCAFLTRRAVWPAAGRAGPQGPISAPLGPSGSSTARAAVLISHGEFPRMLRRVVGPRHPPRPPRQLALLGARPPRRRPLDGHGGMSRPLGCVGARRGRSPTPAAPSGAPRRSLPPSSVPSPRGRHRAPHRRRAPPREARVAALRRRHDRLGGAGSPGLRCSQGRACRRPGGAAPRPPAGPRVRCGIELVLETGSRPMPRTRPIKRLSAGELAELRRELNNLRDPAFDRRSCGVGGVGSRTGRGASATTRGA